MDSLNRYSCARRRVNGSPAMDAGVWDTLPGMSLSDTVTGGKPFLATTVKAFYDDAQKSLFFGFWARDDAVVSDYRKRDDPIYNQDVLELFVCDTPVLHRYKEFQVSPYNVQYDADITYHSEGKFDVNVSWDFEGWRTETAYAADANSLASVWTLPFSGFASMPEAGASWRMNIYRCDHSERGVELQAWSPTGARQFHVPERFGWLDFTE